MTISRLPGAGLRGWIVLALLLATGSVQAKTLKIATLSPDGSAWMQLLRAGGEEIESRTDGRVEFRFYPGGVMGDDRAVLRKIRLGQLHGAVLTAGGLTQTYTDIQLYNLPLAFESYAEVDHVREELDPILMAGLAEEGFRSFGIAEVGFAYAMSKQPVTSVADVQQQRVWTPDGDPGAARALQSFGVSPIPLSIADVLGGLQTGLINGVTVPPVGAIALQWHTQLDYLLDLPLLYVYGLLAVGERAFRGISEEDQAVIEEVMSGVVTDVNTRSRADHESALAALLAHGLERRTPDAAEIAEWREYSDRATERLVDDGYVSADLAERLAQRLEEFRSRVD